MKWYTAISSYSSPEYIDMLKVAILTCQKNTKFKPNIICNRKCIEIEKIKDQFGVNVVYYSGKIFNTFCDLFKNDNRLLGIAGTYLRADIPIIETEDDYILYTDADVIFGNPSKAKLEIPAPVYFAAAPEFDIGNYSYFNAGSMLMNVKNMASDYNRFADFVMPNFEQLFNHAHDQGAYNHLYKGQWSPLPPEYNWKPGWGINDKAVVVHFHGPKPNDIEKYFNGKLTNVKIDVPVDGTDLYRRMIEKNIDGNRFYLEQYKQYTNEVNSR